MLQRSLSFEVIEIPSDQTHIYRIKMFYENKACYIVMRVISKVGKNTVKIKAGNADCPESNQRFC